MAEMTLEHRLMELIEQDDPSLAIPELYRLYAPMLHKILAWLPHDFRQEIINEALYKAWTKRDQFNKERGSFSVWFMGIAKYTAIDRWRLENKEKIIQKERARRLTRIEDIRQSDEYRELRSEILALLQPGVSLFKGLQRAVLLADLESFPESVDSKKLALILKTSANSIYTQRNKAYKKLESRGIADPRRDSRFKI
ncbi:MAG: sigma-70 family RNA polymerase sigma factor [Planctomycetota bacterium]|nr:sigma-70 family RNA polymerase sigma factor [Planctomycetota bacterium]